MNEKIYITKLVGVGCSNVTITGAYPTKELAYDAIKVPGSMRSSGICYEVIEEVKLFTQREDIENYCQYCGTPTFYKKEDIDFPTCESCRKRNGK